MRPKVAADELGPGVKPAPRQRLPDQWPTWKRIAVSLFEDLVRRKGSYRWGLVAAILRTAIPCQFLGLSEIGRYRFNRIHIAILSLGTHPC